jgi:acyl-CoA synthetase (AMP-forming)/AMP-acid ligase II
MQPILVGAGHPTLDVTTLPEALERSAHAGAHLWTAEKDADAIELSLREILDRATRVAKHLMHEGLHKGDRVVVMLPTGPEWLAAFFGVLLAGGVAVPVGPNLSFGGMDRFAETVRAILDDAGAHVLVGNKAIEPYLPALKGDGKVLETWVRVDEVPEHHAPVIFPSPDDASAAVIQYTSGTTGRPKGVVLGHRSLLTNAWMIGERAGMKTTDVGVSWLPLFHDMGLVGGLLTTLYWRYPLLMMPVESFLMQPRRWLQWMSKKRATMSVAPNFAYQLVVDRVADRHLEGLDLSAMRHAFNGSEAVRPSTLRGFEQRFGRIGFDGAAFQPVYGMAENTLAATFPRVGARWTSRAHDGGLEFTSVGTPLVGVSVAIVDAEGKPIGEGGVGEIRLRSPSLMHGYYRNEEATEAVLKDGWLRTGDLGFVKDGELHVTGRAKELIIKRGRNYPPDDFERIAVEAGKGRVLRAAAFGNANEAQGTEDVVVVLETRPTVTEHEREQLTKDVFGALVAELGIGADVTLTVPPRTIERTTSGKLRRAALRTRWLEGKLPRHDQALPDDGGGSELA